MGLVWCHIVLGAKQLKTPAGRRLEGSNIGDMLGLDVANPERGVKWIQVLDVFLLELIVRWMSTPSV